MQRSFLFIGCIHYLIISASVQSSVTSASSLTSSSSSFSYSRSLASVTCNTTSAPRNYTSPDTNTTDLICVNCDYIGPINSTYNATTDSCSCLLSQFNSNNTCYTIVSPSPTPSRSGTSSVTPTRSGTPTATPSVTPSSSPCVPGSMMNNTCACKFEAPLFDADTVTVLSCVNCANYTLAPLIGGVWNASKNSCSCNSTLYANISGTCIIPPSPSATPTRSVTSTATSTPTPSSSPCVPGSMMNNTCACRFEAPLFDADTVTVLSCVNCANYTLAPLRFGVWNSTLNSCACNSTAFVNRSGTCGIPPSPSATSSGTPTTSRTPSSSPCVSGSIMNNTCGCKFEAPLFDADNVTVLSCIPCSNYFIAPLIGGVWSATMNSCACNSTLYANVSGTCIIPPSASPTSSRTPSGTRTPSTTLTANYSASVTPSITPTQTSTPSACIPMPVLDYCTCNYAPIYDPNDGITIIDCVTCGSIGLVDGVWNNTLKQCVCYNPSIAVMNSSGVCVIVPNATATRTPTSSRTPSRSATGTRTPSISDTPSVSATPSSSASSAPVCLFNSFFNITTNLCECPIDAVPSFDSNGFINGCTFCIDFGLIGGIYDPSKEICICPAGTENIAGSCDIPPSSSPSPSPSPSPSVSASVSHSSDPIPSYEPGSTPSATSTPSRSGTPSITPSPAPKPEVRLFLTLNNIMDETIFLDPSSVTNLEKAFSEAANITQGAIKVRWILGGGGTVLLYINSLYQDEYDAYVASSPSSTPARRILRQIDSDNNNADANEDNGYSLFSWLTSSHIHERVRLLQSAVIVDAVINAANPDTAAQVGGTIASNTANFQTMVIDSLVALDPQSYSGVSLAVTSITAPSASPSSSRSASSTPSTGSGNGLGALQLSSSNGGLDIGLIAGAAGGGAAVLILLITGACYIRRSNAALEEEARQLEEMYSNPHQSGRGVRRPKYPNANYDNDYGQDGNDDNEDDSEERRQWIEQQRQRRKNNNYVTTSIIGSDNSSYPEDDIPEESDPVDSYDENNNPNGGRVVIGKGRPTKNKNNNNNRYGMNSMYNGGGIDAPIPVINPLMVRNNDATTIYGQGHRPFTSAPSGRFVSAPVSIRQDNAYANEIPNPMVNSRRVVVGRGQSRRTLETYE